MHKNIRLLSIVIGFLLIVQFNGEAQSVVTRPDSVAMRKSEAVGKKKQETERNSREVRNSENPQNNTRGNNDAAKPQNSSAGLSNQNAKQVTSAKPDMSKARGARPPAVVRPSGSRIPKGIGKPGGAPVKGGK